MEKALQHSYRGRKEKKRDWRSLWIAQINAATREHQASYLKPIVALYTGINSALIVSYAWYAGAQLLMHGGCTQIHDKNIFIFVSTGYCDAGILLPFHVRSVPTQYFA